MDRQTKIIFAFIAAGLWANAAVAIIRPARAENQEVWQGRIAAEAQSIAGDVHTLVSGGIGCSNSNLCK
jgi:hypothetical protein